MIDIYLRMLEGGEEIDESIACGVGIGRRDVTSISGRTGERDNGE